MVLRLLGIIDKGTYEFEIENLVIPSTRYPNHFSFLHISPKPSDSRYVPRRERQRRYEREREREKEIADTPLEQP